MDPDFKYQPVIILLTDGLNRTVGTAPIRISTLVRKLHATKSRPPRSTCTPFRSILAVIPTSTLLQDCASDPHKFFLLTSADQMTAMFNTIGTNLTKLRVAQ